MQINTIKIVKSRSSKRVGRGGKKGTYSGGGMNGQKVRAGYSRRATFEGGRTTLVAKTKKVRGFKAVKKPFQIVSLSSVGEKFNDGEEVNPATLKQKKLIKKDFVPTKVLFGGEFSRKLNFSGLAFSKKAEELIKEVGGQVK